MSAVNIGVLYNCINAKVIQHGSLGAKVDMPSAYQVQMVCLFFFFFFLSSESEIKNQMFICLLTVNCNMHFFIESDIFQLVSKWLGDQS